MNNVSRNLIGLFLLFALIQPAAAELRVFACEPEWGALAQELGKDQVTVYTATTALQDPHRIQARPSLIAQVRKADLLVCTGAELEAGWLPLLLRQSGNPRIQPGQPGYLEAANLVQRLEIPARLDRADGDIHTGGNPHIQTDPHNIALVANALTECLAQLDPSNAAFYQEQHRAFSARWQTAMQAWEQQAAPLKGMGIVVKHRAWPYLIRWLGLREVTALEPKPGIEPSITHLTAVLDKLQHEPAQVIIRTPYDDAQSSEWLAERAKIPAVILPYTVGGSEQAMDLFGLFDDTIKRLLAVRK
ncbi:MAG: zinc ABC transporter substrate-binding protein [Gammaproteobacteria bacterium]